MNEYFGFSEELLNKKRAKKGNAYANAELYDLLVSEGSDDRFYVQLASERGGRVLDLACGSGRLIPALLDAGLSVTGLDLSPAMLTRAAERLGERVPQVALVEGDMRSFCFSDSFDTIIIPYCSFMYMHSDEDRLTVLDNCYNHLTESGYLVFDFLAGTVELGEGWPELALQGMHPLTEEIFLSVVQIKGLAPDLRLLNQINYVYPKEPSQGQITVYSSKEAVLEPKRVVGLLEQVGFAVEGVYNNSSLEEYNGGEECLIVAHK
jgi:SAM-dependent methyltransferase